MKTSIKVVFLVCAAMSLACARRVVLEPEQVAQKNSSDWNVKKAPQGAARPLMAGWTRPARPSSWPSPPVDRQGPCTL